MNNMIESDFIVLKSAYNKTPGMKYKISPCGDKFGKMPSSIRRVDKDGEMILSEKDKTDWNSGKAVFLPENEPIVVEHGTTFDLKDPLQKAQWEAIKNSPMIAQERTEIDDSGNYIIDGGKSIVDKYNNPRGRYGLAELYIERPGRMAKAKNDMRKLILNAQNLIVNDSLDHLVLLCKLFDKDMSHSNSNDVEDYLMTQAEKNPERVLKYYNSEEAAMRLLILTAKDKGILTVKPEGMYYGEIKIGVNMDLAVEFLKADKIITNELKKETFPDLEKKVSTKK